MTRTPTDNDLLILRSFELDPDWWARRVEPRLIRDPETGCLIWRGSRDTGGYGRVYLPAAVGGIKVAVHRVALVRELGRPLGEGLTVDHLCRNRTCAEPTHLDEVSHQVNIARGNSIGGSGAAARLKTGLCPRGHDDWVRDSDRGPNSWRCRECRRERSARRYAAVRYAASLLDLTQADYIARYGESHAVAEWLIDLWYATPLDCPIPIRPPRA